MKTLTKINSNDDTQYGSAGNGLQVGSGFDVVVKRESTDTALVNVIQVATKREWLTEYSVEPEEDLQALAVRIGNAPMFGDGGWASQDSDEWDHYAERWDAIEVE